MHRGLHDDVKSGPVLEAYKQFKTGTPVNVKHLSQEEQTLLSEMLLRDSLPREQPIGTTNINFETPPVTGLPIIRDRSGKIVYSVPRSLNPKERLQVAFRERSVHFKLSSDGGEYLLTF